MAAKAKTTTTHEPREKLLQALPPQLKQDADSGFDRLLHEKTRLAIVSALAANECLSFNELKNALDISDGNLSVHARKLEQAGYLECSKRFAGRVPRTEYFLTEQGRQALLSYISHMEALIGAVKKMDI